MEASKIKTELEQLYSLIPEKIKREAEPPLDFAVEKPIDFLRTLYNYVDYIKNKELLQKIITVEKERKAQELIKLAKSSMESRHAHEHFDIFQDHIKEEKRNNDEVDQDPIYNYGLLLDAYESFEIIKDLKTEEEMRKFPIVLKRESPYGNSTSNFYGYGLLNLAMFRYPEPGHLHIFLLNALNELERGKPLNKYLEYDNENGVLYFNDQVIKIRVKNSPTVGAHLLLQYLVKNKPFEKHGYYEFNDNNVFLDEKSAKACLHICNDIQKKVLENTGIPDFLDYNTGEDMYVRINPKHSLNITDK
ncbi:MAG: hypothetical protein RI935_22 [Candidatus Parcubacteria bacterium]|jgi:hypothetical protein